MRSVGKFSNDPQAIIFLSLSVPSRKAKDKQPEDEESPQAGPSSRTLRSTVVQPAKTRFIAFIFSLRRRAD